MFPKKLEEEREMRRPWSNVAERYFERARNNMITTITIIAREYENITKYEKSRESVCNRLN